MKYVEVLPLTNTGSKDQSFIYETDLDVSIGSVVLVSLRNRNLRGIVTKIVAKPKFKTKAVKKVQMEEPALTDIQLVLAKKISEYYFSSLGDTISCMLPFALGKKRRNLKEKKSGFKKEFPHKLTPGQKKIFDEISKAKPSSKHLLFGVTGSGKTEIYLQLIADALKKNQGTIILVPEISLTPQALERYEARFQGKVAVWHSNLLETEKYDTWEKIRSGEKKVVIGARSAIFTPVQNLGYIFIDEEHETSYKQDQAPRYETHRVAEWLTDLSGAKLVLGSATPKIETYHKTQTKKYSLCTLNKRIIQESMPPVKVVDLRDEFKKGNKSIFSDDLYEAVNDALSEKKQVMLFVNRRGASTFVVCRDCGYVAECPNCEIPLTFHLSNGKVGDLKCHHCDHKENVPTFCPKCKSTAIKYFGLGTQKAEIEAKKMFPKAKIVRMDRDTTKKRGSHGEIYQSFAKKEFDIIIGTQLIAKGWDLPNVSVVGVVSADTMLNLPDFRSAERTFDLLTQVAGRTGRGFHPGKVVIQTYSPENYAIRLAAKHDFESFYEREIKERKKYSYPPFSILVKLVYSSSDIKKAQKEAAEMAEALEKKDKKDVSILGPSPAFLAKLAGKYRYQIVIKLKTDEAKKYILDIIQKNYKPGWTVDVDPESLL